MDLLVSENESSSSESLLPNTAELRISEQGGSTPRQDDSAQEVRQKEYQNPLSSEEEEDESDDQFDEDIGDKDGDSAANIKNEMMKSKITTSASVVLNKLPPDSSKVIKKITQETDKKITIRCQPIGSAPQLSPTVFKISETQPFATLIKFINKKLKKKLQSKEDAIYCYVKNSFAPSPDEIIGNLHKHFATNNELVVSYCNVVAFG